MSARIWSAYLLLHGSEEAPQACCPWAAGYGFVGILDLAVEVVRARLGAVFAGLLLRGWVFWVALLLDVVVCGVHSF